MISINEHRKGRTMCRLGSMLAVATMLLAGCKLEAAHEIYVGDLVDFMDDPANELSARSVFRLAMPSEQSCNDDKEKIIILLGPYFEDAEAAECEQAASSAWLSFSANTRFWLSEDRHADLQDDSMFGFIVAAKTDRSFVLDAAISLERRAALREEAKRAFHRSFDLYLSAMAVELRNDSGTSYVVEGAAMLMDGEPASVVRADLSRGHVVRLEVSDVARVGLMKWGRWPLVSVSPRS